MGFWAPSIQLCSTVRILASSGIHTLTALLNKKTLNSLRIALSHNCTKQTHHKKVSFVRVLHSHPPLQGIMRSLGWLLLACVGSCGATLPLQSARPTALPPRGHADHDTKPQSALRRRAGSGTLSYRKFQRALWRWAGPSPFLREHLCAFALCSFHGWNLLESAASGLQSPLTASQGHTDSGM
ncbi:Hypothetical predicted protein [Marmota monax]|uniref:Uncharacterized protein n=1 Tax=Marmota monax TaxID=9995 RepID=A0A5E4CIZ5_MARMO|nr:hypothetical protein GHT09_012494 [Marmota monax]VTJ81300.1 Hypothetical predicted protein [Marmota monax]